MYEDILASIMGDLAQPSTSAARARALRGQPPMLDAGPTPGMQPQAAQAAQQLSDPYQQAPQPQQPQPMPQQASPLSQTLAQRRQQLEGQQQAMMAPPDLTQMQNQYQQQMAAGDRQMVLAMAAQEAGMQPLQAHYLKQAAAARDPMKMGTGTMGPGGYVSDPTAEREMGLKRIDAQLNQLQRAEQAAATAEQREEFKKREEALARERMEYQRETQVMIRDMANQNSRDIKQMGIDAAGGSGGMAGPSAVVGSDADGKPVYRHTKSGTLFTYGDDGEPVKYKGPVGAKPTTPKEPTESERAAAGYAGRAEQALRQIEKMGDRGTRTTVTELVAKVPLIGDRLRATIESKDMNLRRAAEVEFARAKLRAESGAVIGEQEAIEEARSLFPQPGDTEETIAYKRTLLENAVAALKIKAGTAGPGSKASNAAGMPNSSGAGAGGDPLGLRK